MLESNKTLVVISIEMINNQIVRAMRERFFKLYHGDPMSISTANHIYGELKKRGYSVRNWAIEHGFRPRTVQECIHTYAPCKQRKPANGTVSLRVMQALGTTLGVDLYGGNK